LAKPSSIPDDRGAARRRVLRFVPDQIDSAISAERAMPGIRDTVGRDPAILADGGVGSGLDVRRYVALGPIACGEAGGAHMPGMLRTELLAAMAFTELTRPGH
jgi:isopentenyl diphosphate isomerase/L-lactate dehydrogenase-like FMN-dependent dehydrogenase